ncbi:MAG: hypothetical protein WBZ36_09585, partial [Candidatus Nitrosopolaris sp.]
MLRLINIIERKHRLQITIVILIIVTTSIWIPYNTSGKGYGHIMTKKAPRGLTFVKNIDILRTIFELYNESSHKSYLGYGIPTASASSSAKLFAGTVNQDNTTSNQSGLTVDTYPVGVAVNPVTKKI